MLQREKEKEIYDLLKEFPVVGILGPRQCGKTTLAKEIINRNKTASRYIDLENPDEKVQLQNPTMFFEINRSKLICLDEIQLEPELMKVIRSEVDKTNDAGQFLLLGSASPELIKYSSETLAGRIAYVELHPFSPLEVLENNSETERDLWVRGGFPRSYLAGSSKMSFTWRKHFIKTFLERDLRLWGVGTSPESMRRFWRMCAHLHGQVMNYSMIGKSLGVSHTTARHYLDIMEQTFMISRVEAYSGNFAKRIVRSPKVFINDSGILHALCNVRNYEDLLGNPAAGFSWEGFVIQSIKRSISDCELYYIKTTEKREIDIVLKLNNTVLAIECKFSTAPKLSKGFYKLMQELKINQGYVVSPVEQSFPVQENIEVVPLIELLQKLQKLSD